MPRPNDPVNYDELTLANTVSIAALIAVLERKGVVARAEVVDEVERIKKEREAKIKEN